MVLSNIYDKAFLQKQLTRKFINYFGKKEPSQMFDLALNTSSEIMAKIDICKYSVDFGEELCT